MSGNSKIIVYVVDDDKSVRQALSMLLLSAGMDVQTYELVEEFLKCKPREENACLISDIKMKGLNGFDLQQKLNNRGIKIPVVFLTAFDTQQSRQRAKQSGAAGYLRKPVDSEALLDTIQWAVSSSSSSKV